MPQPSHAARVCPACDGFASAAITLGGRDHKGQRRTITAHCRTCHGTGTVTASQTRAAAPSAVSA
ncbi:hypothetical protein ACFYRC_09315 [Streptomyces sp. NPDC005279]|uniref:hypothetical protein n=1 Tax=Streptomyces sp. NPDC005279 TaxID=3364712 RepID=UPI00369C2A26